VKEAKYLLNEVKKASEQHSSEF